jgi:hypothetical protein
MARDVPAGNRAVRMKDITPSVEQVSPPDIPDEIPDTPVDQTPKISSEEPDREAEFLTKLQSDYSNCDSEKEVAALKATHKADIAKLTKAGKAKANAILEGEL